MINTNFWSAPTTSQFFTNRFPTHTTPTSCTSQNTTTPMNKATHNPPFGDGCVIRQAVVECAASYRSTVRCVKHDRTPNTVWLQHPIGNLHLMPAHTTPNTRTPQITTTPTNDATPDYCIPFVGHQIVWRVLHRAHSPVVTSLFIQSRSHTSFAQHDTRLPPWIPITTIYESDDADEDDEEEDDSEWISSPIMYNLSRYVCLQDVAELRWACLCTFIVFSSFSPLPSSGSFLSFRSIAIGGLG